MVSHTWCQHLEPVYDPLMAERCLSFKSSKDNTLTDAVSSQVIRDSHRGGEAIVRTGAVSQTPGFILALH